MVKQDRLLGPVMRERNGACIALRDGRCSIYEDRPKVCRDFEVGGAECQSRQMVPWANAGQPQRLTEAGRAYLLGRLEEQPSPSSVAPRRRSGA
jgi:Fe-S-cluster containining protein